MQNLCRNAFLRLNLINLCKAGENKCDLKWVEILGQKSLQKNISAKSNGYRRGELKS